MYDNQVNYFKVIEIDVFGCSMLNFFFFFFWSKKIKILLLVQVQYRNNFLSL